MDDPIREISGFAKLGCQSNTLYLRNNHLLKAKMALQEIFSTNTLFKDQLAVVGPVINSVFSGTIEPVILTYTKPVFYPDPYLQFIDQPPQNNVWKFVGKVSKRVCFESFFKPAVYV